MPYHSKAKGKSKRTTKKKTPKGYHRMPSGRLMKGATHKSSKKKK